MRINRSPFALAPLTLAAVLIALTAPVAHAQFGPGGPPAVGVTKVQRRPVIESNEFVGRIQAIDRVDLVARVTAFLEEREFVEGTEVDKGALLYRLERGPFEADVQAKAAAVAQNQALLRNATVTLGRANSLLSTPAGQQSTVDTAQANQGSQAALVAQAQAQLKASQINLDYTEIRAPVAGRITRTAITEGNVVSPTVGASGDDRQPGPDVCRIPDCGAERPIDLRNKYMPPEAACQAVVVKAPTKPDGSAVPGQDGQAGLRRPERGGRTPTRSPCGRSSPNPLIGRACKARRYRQSRPGGWRVRHRVIIQSDATRSKRSSSHAHRHPVGPAGQLCLRGGRGQQGGASGALTLGQSTPELAR